MVSHLAPVIHNAALKKNTLLVNPGQVPVVASFELFFISDGQCKER
jgi:hypothetical protein